MPQTEVTAKFGPFDPATAVVELAITSPDNTVSVVTSAGEDKSFPEAPGHYAVVPTAVSPSGVRVSGPALSVEVPDLTPLPAPPVVPSVSFTFGPASS